MNSFTYKIIYPFLLLGIVFFNLNISDANARIAESVAMWQKWAGMVNILELINSADFNRRYRVTAYNGDGEIVSAKNFVVEAKTERDLNINKELLSNTMDDSGYIIVLDNIPVTASVSYVTSEDTAIYGNLVQYRYSEDSTKVDFAITTPFNI
ncbi:MAG: hypothetical protein IT292_02375 [Deltaproteobacteria bacterium]|nr:hypothetical protein [Deltaproteobacteria bacterium]